MAASSAIGRTALTLALHDFNAERGEDDYGRDVVLLLEFPVWKGRAARVKFAHTNAQAHATHPDKFRVMLTHWFGN